MRQRRNAKATLSVIPGGRNQEHPPPPTGILAVTKGEWNSFWEESDLADYIRSSDMPALVRLFILYDEYHRSLQDLRRKPVAPKRRRGEPDDVWHSRVMKYRMDLMQTGRIVRGSTGQLTMNPLLRYLESLDKRIVALEDRFGFNLQTRHKLGLNVLRARTLAEQNAMITQTNVDDEAEADDDPTIAALLESHSDGRRSSASD